MSENSLESLVTPGLVRTIFSGYIIEEDHMGWIILICGRLLTINGKVFFNSREQAVKAFYNSYHWRVCRHMHLQNHPESDYYGWWRDEERTNYWRTLKAVCERDYGLKFVRVWAIK